MKRLNEIKLMNEGGTGSMLALSLRFVQYKGNARNDGHGHQHES